MKKVSFSARLWQNMKKHKGLYLMILPVVAFYLVFCAYPMYGAQIAFRDYTPKLGVFHSPWAGLKHFGEFFKSVYFERLIRNTFSINLKNLVFGFPAPILFALLLNEVRSQKYKKFVQTVSYMPHFISAVVICGLMLDFCKTNGVITSVFTAITGQEASNMFSHSAYFQPLYVLMCIWQEFGWDSIIYFAALTGIDQSLYEAAEIDGANRWKKILHVTLPGISPTIVILLIMRIGNMMTLGWDKILLLYNPMVYEKADVISTYVYRIGLMNFEYSFAAAVGFFNSIINFILLILANSVSRKVNETSLW